MANAIVGTLSVEIKNLLGLRFAAGAPILIGPGNIRHMLSRHPYEYAKYGESIPSIVESPDYVGINTKDGSIEYIKEYPENREFIKAAVRASGEGSLFVRSLYVVSGVKILRFVNSGRLRRPPAPTHPPAQDAKT